MTKIDIGKQLRDETKTTQPPMYKVLVHNDPVTPMNVVVGVLVVIFRQEQNKAIEIMWEAHRAGVALVMVTWKERAEALCDQAHSLARTQKLPLKFTYEPEA